ncbi:MAG: hypothetical protein ACRD6U_12105 [Nitrososphaeraceae archaeon]
MNSNNREKPEQMPGSQDPAETDSVVSEQGGIPGERKEVMSKPMKRLHQ